ncbi:zf-HC2 domain-containing protein [Embleya sp. AB8]|uniref:zf-HC2 domain-containing protein n=1 Tax=Embleya sp. AB8 TaxID=3156304 RepID=UPI003C784400
MTPPPHNNETTSRTEHTWHIPVPLLTRYLTGTLPVPHVMSIEAHLTACPTCRAEVPVDRAWLAGSWDRLDAALDQPPWPERALTRCGMRPHVARLLTATPALSRAWLLAVIAVLAFGTAAASLAGDTPGILLAFLIGAPVLPLAGVALAYGPGVDRAYELHAATPLAGPRLLFLRAGAVLVTAATLTGLATPFLPGPPGLGAAWLLPALALTLACLAAGTRVPLPVAAAGLTLTWIAGVLGTQRVDRYLLFAPGAQAAWAGAVPLLALVVYARRRRLDPGSYPADPPSGSLR